MGYGVLFLSLYSGLFWAPNPFTWWIWVGLGLTGVLLGLNVSHDAAHGSFFRSKLWNEILYYLSFSLLGVNAYLWQLRHVKSHHLFPNVDECDADIDDNPLIRLSPQKPWRPYHQYQHRYAPLVYLFYSLIWVFVKDFMILRKKQLANLRQISHPKGQILLFYIAKGLYLLTFIGAPILWGSFSALEVCMGFVAMHFVSGSAFIYLLAPSHFAEGRAFSTLDEEGYLPGSWSRHQIATSLDYHANQRWANWIFGGFNAHAAHHLFPGISHVHYPAISALIKDAAKQYQLPYQNLTWPEAVAAHFTYLKKLGLPPAKNQSH